MTFRHFYCTILAGSCFAMHLMAQTSPVAAFSQTFTTGMVGFATNQTARLSVLNLNPVPATAAGAAVPLNCTVDLRFFDGTNRLLVPATVVPNLAPQTATYVDLARNSANPPGVAATIRAQIRGVVTVNPPPSPSANPTPVGLCRVKITLEIVDADGSTVSLTTDTSQIGPSVLVPFFHD